MEAPRRYEHAGQKRFSAPLGRLLCPIQTTFAHPHKEGSSGISQLSPALGVQPSVEFFDVYSIDDPDLLAYIRRPDIALLYTCLHEVYIRARHTEKEVMDDYKGFEPQQAVMWFRQTISGSCRLVSLLHSLSNDDARQHIRSNSELDKTC